jgi:hypothetical protein
MLIFAGSKEQLINNIVLVWALASSYTTLSCLKDVEQLRVREGSGKASIIHLFDCNETILT